ncbi:hypothetical protein VN12_06320 [Pirellula sp. SH-Sr6A]|uniref:hypothetical protein n=1 Tax=Pirellula sp. SH-Sr6A TaxID=1632865 RepID=UPI00078DEDC9|nr:hypothetical protein [Pirellula sp. SH-Sr6A]AMV31717.1 hypothetical protein VN12_06320 [Pirellula sp. SH-Sr6A]
MSHPLLTLRDALVAKLIAMNKSAEARYVEYKSKREVKDGKYLVAIASESDKQFRNVDQRDYFIDVAYQRSLPEATKEKPDPLENNAFLDACVIEVATVKALFQEGGELRGNALADCVAIEILDGPLYLPNHLTEHNIFTSSFRVRFRLEG